MDLEAAARAYHDDPTRERAEEAVRAGEALVTAAVKATPSHPVYADWRERYAVGQAQLYDCLREWKPERNPRFGSFAYPRLRWAMIKHLRACLYLWRTCDDHKWDRHDRLDRTWQTPDGPVEGYDFVPAPPMREPFAAELREAVFDAIDAVLTRSQRRALVRYYYTDFEQTAQAEREGVGQSAIAERLRAAYKKLARTPLTDYARRP